MSTTCQLLIKSSWLFLTSADRWWNVSTRQSRDAIPRTTLYSSTNRFALAFSDVTYDLTKTTILFGILDVSGSIIYHVFFSWQTTNAPLVFSLSLLLLTMSDATTWKDATVLSNNLFKSKPHLDEFHMWRDSRGKWLHYCSSPRTVWAFRSLLTSPGMTM